MKALYLMAGVSIVVCLAAPKLRAQEFVRRATVTDSLEVARNAYERLFDGIQMHRQARSRAQFLIRRAFVRKISLEPITTQEAWDKLLTIHAERDSMLLMLPHKRAERSLLRQRLAAERPSSIRWKNAP